MTDIKQCEHCKCLLSLEEQESGYIGGNFYLCKRCKDFYDTLFFVYMKKHGGMEK